MTWNEIAIELMKMDQTFLNLEAVVSIEIFDEAHRINITEIDPDESTHPDDKTKTIYSMRCWGEFVENLPKTIKDND